MILGIDPDTTTTGLALADESQVFAVGVAKVKRTTFTRMVLEMADQVFYAIEEMHRRLPEEQRELFKGDIVVERCRIYPQSPVKPSSIVGLAHFTGFIGHSALAAVCHVFTSKALQGWEPDYSSPEPSEWKKGVPKQIHQARMYKSLGMGYKKVGTKKDGYAIPDPVPEGLEGVNKSDWKHIGDGIGLARWRAIQKKGLSLRS